MATYIWFMQLWTMIDNTGCSQMVEIMNVGQSRYKGPCINDNTHIWQIKHLIARNAMTWISHSLEMPVTFLLHILHALLWEPMAAQTLTKVTSLPCT